MRSPAPVSHSDKGRWRIGQRPIQFCVVTPRSDGLRHGGIAPYLLAIDVKRSRSAVQSNGNMMPSARWQRRRAVDELLSSTIASDREADLTAAPFCGVRYM